MATHTHKHDKYERRNVKTKGEQNRNKKGGCALVNETDDDDDRHHPLRQHTKQVSVFFLFCCCCLLPPHTHTNTLKSPNAILAIRFEC